MAAARTDPKRNEVTIAASTEHLVDGDRLDLKLYPEIYRPPETKCYRFIRDGRHISEERVDMLGGRATCHVVLQPNKGHAVIVPSLWTAQKFCQYFGCRSSSVSDDSLGNLVNLPEKDDPPSDETPPSTVAVSGESEPPGTSADSDEMDSTEETNAPPGTSTDAPPSVPLNVTQKGIPPKAETSKQGLQGPALQELAESLLDKAKLRRDFHETRERFETIQQAAERLGLADPQSTFRNPTASAEDKGNTKPGGILKLTPKGTTPLAKPEEPSTVALPGLNGGGPFIGWLNSKSAVVKRLDQREDQGELMSVLEAQFSYIADTFGVIGHHFTGMKKQVTQLDATLEQSRKAGVALSNRVTEMQMEIRNNNKELLEGMGDIKQYLANGTSRPVLPDMDRVARDTGLDDPDFQAELRGEDPTIPQRRSRTFLTDRAQTGALMPGLLSIGTSRDTISGTTHGAPEILPESGNPMFPDTSQGSRGMHVSSRGTENDDAGLRSIMSRRSPMPPTIMSSNLPQCPYFIGNDKITFKEWYKVLNRHVPNLQYLPEDVKWNHVALRLRGSPANFWTALEANPSNTFDVAIQQMSQMYGDRTDLSERMKKFLEMRKGAKQTVQDYITDKIAYAAKKFPPGYLEFFQGGRFIESSILNGLPDNYRELLFRYRDEGQLTDLINDALRIEGERIRTYDDREYSNRSRQTKMQDSSESEAAQPVLNAAEMNNSRPSLKYDRTNAELAKAMDGDLKTEVIDGTRVVWLGHKKFTASSFRGFCHWLERCFACGKRHRISDCPTRNKPLFPRPPGYGTTNQGYKRGDNNARQFSTPNQSKPPHKTSSPPPTTSVKPQNKDRGFAKTKMSEIEDDLEDQWLNPIGHSRGETRVEEPESYLESLSKDGMDMDDEDIVGLVIDAADDIDDWENAPSGSYHPGIASLEVVPTREMLTIFQADVLPVLDRIPTSAYEQYASIPCVKRESTKSPRTGEIPIDWEDTGKISTTSEIKITTETNRVHTATQSVEPLLSSQPATAITLNVLQHEDPIIGEYWTPGDPLMGDSIPSNIANIQWEDTTGVEINAILTKECPGISAKSDGNAIETPEVPSETEKKPTNTEKVEQPKEDDAPSDVVFPDTQIADDPEEENFYSKPVRLDPTCSRQHIPINANGRRPLALHDTGASDNFASSAMCEYDKKAKVRVFEKGVLVIRISPDMLESKPVQSKFYAYSDFLSRVLEDQGSHLLVEKVLPPKTKPIVVPKQFCKLFQGTERDYSDMQEGLQVPPKEWIHLNVFPKKDRAKQFDASPPTAESDDDNSICQVCKKDCESTKEKNWIQCDRCTNWFQFECVNLKDMPRTRKWYCGPCETALAFLTSGN